MAEVLPIARIGATPMPAVARVLGRYDRAHIESFIEVAIGLLDVMDGDPDSEDATDVEDEPGVADRFRGPAYGPGCPVADIGEEDDEAGQYDEDCFTADWKPKDGPGCAISDQGGCEHDGREEDYDDEREQMLDDVPMLPAVDLEGRRLGVVNLQSSYRSNGEGVRSADSGRLHRTTGLADRPGMPV